jgi:hypothetical protein
MLTAERVRELLDYDPETGVFTWLVSRCNVKAGSRAGCARSDGYRGIRIDRRRYHEHRLAFLWMKGEWPSADVDHINGAPGDNRWHNLRPASRSQNMVNSRMRRNNVSGTRGVAWHSAARKWVATISIDGRSKYLGIYDAKEDAAAAYARAMMARHAEFVPQYVASAA